MKNSDLSTQSIKNMVEKIDDEEKLKEIERLVLNREKEILHFFKAHEDQHHKKEIEENLNTSKYLIILNYKTDKEKIYNCFSTKESAIEAYQRINDNDKVLIRGNITYHMILGVIFVNHYDVEEMIEV